MEQKTINGIVVALLVLTNGAIYYVQDSGEKTGCRAGWEYLEDEGYFGCETQSGIRKEICFEVYNSSNTENYWCKKGVKVEINQTEIVEVNVTKEIIVWKIPRINKDRIVCDKERCI